MDRVFEYEIPVWHPIAVHFPIVLLLAAAGCVLVWMVADSRALLRASAVLAFLGSAAALIAKQTGEQMEEEAAGSAIVESMLEIHESAADGVFVAAVALTALLCLVLLGDRWWPDRAGTPWGIRLALALLAVATAALVVWTGHVGGIMVWGVAA
ncbi:MAG: putative membrane protein [Rhodothermales bacterium]|jgi:uncharacterized membrane protein